MDLYRFFRIFALIISLCIPFTSGFSLNETVQDQTNKQTWNLKDANIRAVIQTVSLLTGKNFIIDPRVKGNVTFVSQKPMTTAEIYQAFLSMLQVLGYSTIPSGHLIKIVPAMDAKEYGGLLASHAHAGYGDQVVVRVIRINNVSANQLAPIIRSMMQPWASVSAYVPSNSLILVGAADNVSRLVSVIRQMDSRNTNLTSVIRLRHANAKNLANILKTLQNNSRAEGRIVNVSLAADTQSNSLLVNGSIENINRMKYLIRKLDRPVSSGTTMVVHLNYLDSKKLAPILHKVATGENAINVKGKNIAMGTPGISVQSEESDNAVIMHGPTAVLRSLRHVIRQLDVRPSQVLVEAIIVKVNQTLLSQLGIVWGTVDSNGDPTNVVDPTTGVPVNSSRGGGTLSSPNTFALKVTHGIGFISGGSLGVLIHALKSNTASDILATPSIVVLNNKEATIADGKNIGIVNRKYSSTVAGSNNEITPFNTIQRQDVTLSLKVTPQISPNNMIRLKIKQSNNTVDPSSNGDIDNPILDVSKITTNVLVHSGDILVLGGLINNNHVTGVQKIPVLGDIPLVGKLFQYKSHRIEKQNLMVFIKPVILNDQLRANHQTKQRYHYIRSEEIAMATKRKLIKQDLSILPRYEKLRQTHQVFSPASTTNERH